MTSHANRYYNPKLSSYSEDFSHASPRDFINLCLIEFISCFIWISMAEGFKFYHAWLLRSFRRSAYPDRSREIADGQQSWKYFIDSAAVLVFADHEVLRLPKSSSSGSVLWASTAKCDRRGTAVKVSQRRLESISYPTFSVCVCGVIPVLSMILSQKYVS